MQNSKINLWCYVATSKISFGPDRKKVLDELRNHMEDHYAALIEAGYSPEDATEHVVTAMGEPKLIARQLAAIHRSFWGYCLQVCRIAFIILLCLSLLPIFNYLRDLNLRENPSMRDFDVYDRGSYGGNTGRTLLHLSQPGVSFSTDGSTFTTTDASLFAQYSEYYEGNNVQLYVRIQQRTLLPWTEYDPYFPQFAITGWFFARDNFGNIYEGFMEQSSSQSPHMSTHGVQSGLFTYTHDCWINQFPADAEWVDICYERDGRSYSMRIRLAGGDGT